MSASLASTSDDLASIGHALAALMWPAIVLVALIILRTPLKAALGRVSEVDVGTTKVVLQGQADQAANTTKAVLGADPSPTAPAISDAAAKSTSDPAGAVLGAWNAVENATATRTAAKDAPGVTSPSVPDVVNKLFGDGPKSSLVPVAKSLEALRAVAAHNAKAITPATAQSFVAAADDLVRLIGKSV